VDLDRVVAEILKRPGPVRIVAIDGPGGAGKTTLAGCLSKIADAPVVHTDDFASADDPIHWWRRLQAQVIDPLSQGRAGRYQRHDWPTNALAAWHVVPSAPIVIIEGVSAGRLEWARHLSYLIWVETPRSERLRRGLERDGPDALADWEIWMAGEDRHYSGDPTKGRADLVIDGTK
jgi:uridine kinase